jgi:type II secretory pathway pseudopilin PulG
MLPESAHSNSADMRDAGRLPRNALAVRVLTAQGAGEGADPSLVRQNCKFLFHLRTFFDKPTAPDLCRQSFLPKQFTNSRRPLFDVNARLAHRLLIGQQMLLRTLSQRTERGYTLLEIMVVVGIIMVGSAVAIPVTIQMVRNARGDSVMTMTETFLQTARNRAVAERRNIIINFTSESTVQAERVEVPSDDRTVVDQLRLENSEEFLKLDGLPDTPDRFGGADNINFTGGQPVMFTSDGSLIDADGDITNATIFLARPDTPDSARAVTILGITGLTRTWKWRGTWQQ